VGPWRSGRWACRSGDATGRESREADHEEDGNDARIQTYVAGVERPEHLWVRFSSHGKYTLREQREQALNGNAKIGRGQENRGGSAPRAVAAGIGRHRLFVVPKLLGTAFSRKRRSGSPAIFGQTMVTEILRKTRRISEEVLWGVHLDNGVSGPRLGIVAMPRVGGLRHRYTWRAAK